MKELVKDYLKRAEIRIEALNFYLQKDDYADVVRESQEVVELLLKALLLYHGLTIPKFHDVAYLLREFKEYFSDNITKNLKKIIEISKNLRRERELAFYGAEDWIPSHKYTKEDAQAAIENVKFIKEIVEREILKC